MGDGGLIICGGAVGDGEFICGGMVGVRAYLWGCGEDRGELITCRGGVGDEAKIPTLGRLLLPVWFWEFWKHGLWATDRGCWSLVGRESLI